jgi:hypothetical protein
LGAQGKRTCQDASAHEAGSSKIRLWVQTNTFIEGEPQYANSAFGALPVATAHTGEILKMGLQVLERIFRKGYASSSAHGDPKDFANAAITAEKQGAITAAQTDKSCAMLFITWATSGVCCNSATR